MMSLEAMLASLLVLSALALSIQAPPAANPLLEFSSYQQLQDKATIITEIQPSSSLPLPPNLFSPTDAYCYRFRWSDDLPGAYQYSSDFCQQQDAASSTHPSQRSISRGAWKNGDPLLHLGGHLSFLSVDQFERT